MNEMPQNCENKMSHIISPISPNEWPLQIDHENKINNNNKTKKKGGAMILVDDHTHTHTPHHKKSNSSTSEKAVNNNLPPPDPSIVLKCPRCDSTNTKFCYYNNYSLSQPRHFCKACKRYWTRGGTLRNVPVGGGCRKHKRVKRPASNGGGGGGGGVATSHVHPVLHTATHMDLSRTATNNMFYGMPSNNTQMELNFPFSSSNRVLPGFDHMNVLGLGFSSSGLMENGNNNTGFFGSSNGFASSSAAATSNNFAGLMLYDHIKNEGSVGKQVKMDNEEENGLDLDQWNNMNNNSMQLINEQDQHLLQMNSTDHTSSSSSHLWNTNWFDPSSNIGSSSVPSLI